MARTAFRELSEGCPASFAIVGNNVRVAWSMTRERVFRALAAEAGVPCRAFRRRDETHASRAARLATWVAAPVSRSLFILRFREAVGHSVQDEIEHVRMERVFTLLRDTKTPISAVAALCGWRSDIALRWLFRRRTGMSMRQWRRENT